MTWLKPKPFTFLQMPVKMSMQHLCLEGINARMELVQFYWLFHNKKLLLENTIFLELLRLLLILHLYQAIAKFPGDQVINDFHFWCNSMNIFYWIKNSNRKFNSFPENRVGEIHNFLEFKWWSCLKSQLNLPDIVRRTTQMAKLLKCSIWEVPQVFFKNEKDCPKWIFTKVLDKRIVELRKEYSRNFALLTNYCGSIKKCRLDSGRYSM